ncbi:MAG: HdeD family acid-resistance protein [Actinomycetota bacterium]
MSVAPQSVSDRELAREVSGLWWVFLATGILWFIISLVVLRFDETSVTTVGIIIGIVFAVACVNEFVIAGLVARGKWLNVILGIIFLLGALWAFIQPKEAFWALASVLGLLLILKGAFDIIGAVMTKEVNGLWGLGLAVGIIEVLLGFWASQQYYPARAALIIIWVGLTALFRGIGEIVLAFGLRSEHKALSAD